MPDNEEIQEIIEFDEMVDDGDESDSSEESGSSDDSSGSGSNTSGEPMGEPETSDDDEKSTDGKSDSPDNSGDSSDSDKAETEDPVDSNEKTETDDKKEESQENDPDNITIDIVNESGDITPFPANLNDTVGDTITRALSNVDNTGYDFFLKNGVVERFSREMTLREAGIKDGMTIHLGRHGGKTQDSKTEQSANKERLESGYETRSATSTKSEAGSKITLTDLNEIDDMLANDVFGPETADTGTVIITETNGNFKELPVAMTETIGEIITRAAPTADASNFDLLEGQRILARTMTFSDTGIRYGTRLTLQERPMNVYVRTVDGANVRLESRRSQTVNDLKEKFYGERNVPTSHLNLTYQGKPMENDRTLGSYGIRNDSFVDSSYRLRGGAN